MVTTRFYLPPEDGRAVLCGIASGSSVLSQSESMWSVKRQSCLKEGRQP